VLEHYLANIARAFQDGPLNPSVMVVGPKIHHPPGS